MIGDEGRRSLTLPHCCGWWLVLAPFVLRFSAAVHSGGGDGSVKEHVEMLSAPLHRSRSFIGEELQVQLPDQGSLKLRLEAVSAYRVEKDRASLQMLGEV